MKKILLVLIPLLGINLSSCQKADTAATKQELLQKIASDPVYVEFQKALYAQMALIAQNAWDVKAAAEVVFSLDATYDNIPLCDLPKNLFSKVRGSDVFFESSCRLDKAMDELDKKYDFFKMPDEQIDEIKELFLKNGGDKIKDAARKKVFESITNPTGLNKGK
jgi:hypothetical protein